MDLSVRQLSDIIGALSRGRTDTGVSGRGTERGLHARIGVRYRTAIRPMPADGAPASPVRAFLVDVSPDGVGLSLPIALQRGDPFVLLLVRSGHLPLEVRCVVHSCTTAGGNLHKVGASFLEQLDEATAAKEQSGRRAPQKGE